MFKEAFTKLDEKEASDFLARVNPALEMAPFAADKATVLTHLLSFYPGYHLADISDHSVSPPRQVFVIYSDKDLVPVSWKNETLYALNARVPIYLTDGTVEEYAKFFLTYVRGRHGRFLIAETIDDIEWREPPPPAARKAIGKMLVPLEVTGRGQDGTYYLSATMMFRDSLFQARVEVATDGTVRITDEQLLVEDMPVMDDTLGQ